MMEDSSSERKRSCLSEVVSDCVRRWFQETLKEAKAGDLNMQILVAQMYYSGYGVPVDAQKGKLWMTRASRVRSSVWKVSNKRPGYNASDSDSDELDHTVSYSILFRFILIVPVTTFLPVSAEKKLN
uniref:Uncharacterized protein n=1 Tax=Daucus carota subsp. sativus TaxID=79200 RepID=A0A164SZ79_DAUCS